MRTFCSLLTIAVVLSLSGSVRAGEPDIPIAPGSVKRPDDIDRQPIPAEPDGVGRRLFGLKSSLERKACSK